MAPFSATVYFDLLPWESLFYIGIIMAILIIFSLLLRALRRGPKRPPRLRLLLLAVAVVLILIPLFSFDNFLQRLQAGHERNIAETSETPRFPELQTRTYPAPPDQVYDAARNAISKQRGWLLTASDRQRGELQVEVQVPPLLGIFTDDLHITISAAGEGQTRVEARSRSRVGRGDLGENRRHILQFFYALDEQLGR
ncbi:MAG: hypothetical protein KatS3mg057_2388 [Herpetosiphonaceae bacterium]|nr:MAG: hypothetical protein KatS3mg057_2388 [Herpetosiphonaceae bacterium]